MSIFLRKAKADDSQFFFDLRTLPQYQKFFYSESPILFEQHSKWFKARIASSQHIYMVAELNKSYIGLVRFEPLSFPEIFEIGFIMHPNFIGKGLACEMLTKAIAFLSIEIGVSKPLVIASVFQSNYASLRTLQKVGFTLANSEELALFESLLLAQPKSTLLCFK